MATGLKEEQEQSCVRWACELLLVPECPGYSHEEELGTGITNVTAEVWAAKQPLGYVHCTAGVEEVAQQSVRKRLSESLQKQQPEADY